MMIPFDKEMLLNGFLGKLPNKIAARLAKAVEVDRLAGGAELPHDKLLAALRPQLRASQEKARVPSATRYFCRPFEDLLIGVTPKVKQKGHISRASITPVWRWLGTDLIPQQHGPLEKAITEAILRERQADIHERLCELWRAAANAMAPALATPAQRDEASRKLGSKVVAEDAAEMAVLLQAGPEIAKLQDALPEPMVSVRAEDMDAMCAAYDDFMARFPAVAPYVAVIAMARLERPWEALHLAGVFANQSTDAALSGSDKGLVGDLLFDDLAKYQARIASVRPSDFEADPLLEALGSFAELSSGLVREIGIHRDGKWGRTLLESRTNVAAKMEEVLAFVPREILAALPSSKSDVPAGSPLQLDLSRPPDPAKFARAHTLAQVTGHARPFAIAAAFHAKLTTVTDEVVAQLRKHSENMLRELKDGRGGAHAEAHFSALLDLCAPLLGEEETDLLRRRGRVAAAPKARAR